MNRIIVMSGVRHALTFGGGFIAAKGWMDQGMVAEVIGAMMTLAGVAWSLYEKKSR
jgi:hypothetical protein